jgi:hypothetical protein
METKRLMEIALSNLCTYDLRNPHGIGTDIEDEDIKYGNHPLKDCYCDNCFHGRADLAEIILNLIYLND